MGCRTGDHPAGLCLHRDRGHVMGNRVMEFSGQGKTLFGTQLALVSGRQIGAIAGDRATGDEEQDKEYAADDVDQSCGRGDHTESHNGDDERHTERKFPARAPPREGVEQHQDRRHGGEAEVSLPRRHLEDGQQTGDAEASQSAGQRVVTTPEQGGCEADGKERDERPPGQVGSRHALGERRGREAAGEEPVPPTHGRGVGGPGLAPDGTAYGYHLLRLGSAEVRGQVQAVRRMKPRRPSSTAKPRP